MQNEKRNNPLYRSEEITTTNFDPTVHLSQKNYIPKNSTKNDYYYLDTPSKKKEQQEPYTFQSKQNQNDTKLKNLSNNQIGAFKKYGINYFVTISFFIRKS